MEAAHSACIRVLMDFVPNHTSIEHPYARDAAANGGFDLLGLLRPRLGRKPDPLLQLDAPAESQRRGGALHDGGVLVLGAGVRRRWLPRRRRLGHQAAQPGVADGLSRRDESHQARLAPVAEASARDEFYFEQGFDAAYDWTDQLGQWAWGDALGGIAPIGKAMVDVLTDGGQGYHEDALVMRFLNNNDTGQRFVSTYGVDFYRTALAMLLTLPGLPSLRATTLAPSISRTPRSVRSTGRTTRAARGHEEVDRAATEHAGLHSREWLPLAVEPATPLFAYLRTAENGQEPVVVLLNFSGNDLEAAVSVTRSDRRIVRDGALTDLWREPVPAATGGRVTVAIPGWGFRVLARARGTHRHESRGRAVEKRRRPTPRLHDSTTP